LGRENFAEIFGAPNGSNWNFYERAVFFSTDGRQWGTAFGGEKPPRVIEKKHKIKKKKKNKGGTSNTFNKHT